MSFIKLVAWYLLSLASSLTWIATSVGDYLNRTGAMNSLSMDILRIYVRQHIPIVASCLLVFSLGAIVFYDLSCNGLKVENEGNNKQR